MHSLRLNFDVYQKDFTLTDKFCLISITYCFVLFWFIFYFSVFCSFFLCRGGDEPKVKFFLSKCCFLLVLFLYGSIIWTVLTPILFLMWMFAIDPITTNLKALLHSKDTNIHFWTMNIMVFTCTITGILMICRKTLNKLQVYVGEAYFFILKKIYIHIYTYIHVYITHSQMSG